MSRDAVEPWASAMIKAGLTDPRNGRPSMRALAAAAQTTTSTISKMMYGERDTGGDVIQRVARALRMEDRADEISRWVGHARSVGTPFVAHRDADLLTTEEQDAVNELIRLLALPKKRGGELEGTADPTPRLGAGPDLRLVDDEAARDVGRAGSVERERKKQDRAGEPPSDDPSDLEPR